MKHTTIVAFMAFASAIYSFPAVATAAAADNGTHVNVEHNKWYLGSSGDMGILSTASMQRPDLSNSLAIPRFTYVINLGVTVNRDWKHAGFYTGLEIHNIGFIEKQGDYTIKHRTYNLGVPLGIKIGNPKAKLDGIVGGGADVPFNYREKEFIKRGDKQKLSEWMGNRANHFMPYVFAGVGIRPGMTIKLEYYLDNFLNPAYGAHGFSATTVRTGDMSHPYKGYDVHIMALTLGFQIPYTKTTRRFPFKSHKTTDTSHEL